MNPNQTPDTALLPRDASTGEPLQPTPQPGYYPGFSTMAQKGFWDAGYAQPHRYAGRAATFDSLLHR